RLGHLAARCTLRLGGPGQLPAALDKPDGCSDSDSASDSASDCSADPDEVDAHPHPQTPPAPEPAPGPGPDSIPTAVAIGAGAVMAGEGGRRALEQQQPVERGVRKRLVSCSRHVLGAQAQVLALLKGVRLDWRDKEWGNRLGSSSMEADKEELVTPEQALDMFSYLLPLEPLLLARSQLPRLRSLLDRLLRLTPPLPAPLLAASAASRYLAPDTIISDTDLVLLKVVPPVLLPPGSLGLPSGGGQAGGEERSRERQQQQGQQQGQQQQGQQQQGGLDAAAGQQEPRGEQLGGDAVAMEVDAAPGSGSYAAGEAAAAAGAAAGGGDGVAAGGATGGGARAAAAAVVPTTKPDTAGPAAGQGIDPRWAAVQRRLFYWVSLANDPEEAIKGTLTSEAGSRDVERQAAHLLSDLALNPLRQGSWERLGQLYHKALGWLLEAAASEAAVQAWSSPSSQPLALRVCGYRRCALRCLVVASLLEQGEEAQGLLQEALAQLLWWSVQRVTPLYDSLPPARKPPPSGPWLCDALTAFVLYSRAARLLDGEWLFQHQLGKLTHKLQGHTHTARAAAAAHLALMDRLQQAQAQAGGRQQEGEEGGGGGEGGGKGGGLGGGEPQGGSCC
ncbi:hypothetical protein QJQ45_026781, partial [Haematococcus lacustris]